LFVKNKDGGEGKRGGLINFPPLKKGGWGEGGYKSGGLDRGFMLSMTLMEVTIP